MKPIPGYEGAYAADEQGQIWSVPRVSIQKTGRAYRVGARILSPKLTATGYHAVSLWLQGKHRTLLAHRLVLSAFIEADASRPQVNHKNGIRTDNSLANLEWCSAKENALHSFKVLGRKSAEMPKGDDSAIAKPVKAIDSHGTVVWMFGSLAGAVKEGYTASGISSCLHGHQKTHRGLKWSLINMENK